jgi:hypothetical protein
VPRQLAALVRQTVEDGWADFRAMETHVAPAEIVGEEKE